MDSFHDEPGTGAAFLDVVREVAGEDGVAAVLRARGGTNVWVPRSALPHHWLARCIGLEAAEKVCAAHRVFDADGKSIGRLRITLPLGSTSTVKQQVAAAERLLLQGESVMQVVVRLRISHGPCTDTGLGSSKPAS